MKQSHTRSQWVSEPSPLDDIFGSPVDAEEFADALYSIPDLILESNESIALVRKLSKGEPDTVIAPKPLAQEVTSFIRIIHGWHNNDYVWHIEPASIRRPWRIPEDQVLYAIAKIMNSSLPEIEAKLWLPEGSWELRTITFKAIDLSNNWAFDSYMITNINGKLFEALNKIV